MGATDPTSALRVPPASDALTRVQLCAERRAAPRSGFAFVGRVSEDARADCTYVRSERAWLWPVTFVAAVWSAGREQSVSLTRARLVCRIVGRYVVQRRCRGSRAARKVASALGVGRRKPSSSRPGLLSEVLGRSPTRPRTAPPAPAAGGLPEAPPCWRHAPWPGRGLQQPDRADGVPLYR